MIDTLHIILPGLFHTGGKFEQPSESFPSLFKLLSKATIVPDRPESFEGVLKQHFSGFSSKEIPAGALSAFAAGDIKADDNHIWMRSDPVYLKSDAHSLYCYGNHHLQISNEEAQSLVEVLNEHFCEDGLHIHMVTPYAWVIKLSEPQSMATNALADVEGQSIEPRLPSGPDALMWHKRLTESQLILERHPVNLARKQKGLLPINSLWFWGLGALPAKIDTYFDFVFANSKIMRGLCELSNTPCMDKLESFDDFIENLPNKAHHTCAVIDTRFKRANNLTDMELRASLLETYEQNWFAPIANALVEGLVKTIYLDACHGRRFVISKRHFKYFWRKNAEIMTYDS